LAISVRTTAALLYHPGSFSRNRFSVVIGWLEPIGAIPNALKKLVASVFLHRAWQVPRVAATGIILDWIYPLQGLGGHFPDKL